MSEYYAFLSSLTNLVSGPLSSLEARIGIPIVSVLILGLIGSTSPCQLTTNITALAFVSRETGSPRRILGSALAYTIGKVVVYSLMGVLIILAGLKLSGLAVPVAIFVRKALGPLLIVLGLLMLGVLRPNLSVGRGLSARLEATAAKGGRLSAFLLGVAFSFAFCPTLFWLFFGLVVPLSLSTPGGLLYPGVFALGLTLPFLALAGLLMLGIQNINRYVHQLRRFDHYARQAAGVIFVVGGINETVVYWLS